MLDRRFDMKAIFIPMTYDGGYNSTTPNFFTLELLSVFVIHSDQKYNIELFLSQFVLIDLIVFDPRLADKPLSIELSIGTSGNSLEVICLCLCLCLSLCLCLCQPIKPYIL